MLYGVIAPNEGESMFFAVSAASENAATEIVRKIMGARFQVVSDDLEGLLQSQYGRISELTTI